MSFVSVTFGGMLLKVRKIVKIDIFFVNSDSSGEKSSSPACIALKLMYING